MRQFQQFFSSMGPGCGGAVVVGNVSSCFATSTLVSGSCLTFASPIVVNLGGQAQWSSVIPTTTLSQWQRQAIKRLKEVLSLPENWDSYGSPPPTLDAANTAMGILTGIDLDYFVAPRVVPISGGGLQLEWRLGTRALELEIHDDGLVEYLTAERGEPIEEGYIHLINEVRPIFLWILSAEPMQEAA